MDTVVVQAVRVSLLVLMTFTFAAIWSADYSVAAVDKHPPRVDQKSNPKIDSYDLPSTQREIHQTASVGDSSLIGEFNLGIPLPEGIRTGTYLIINQFGRTMTRFVVQPDPALGVGEGDLPRKDHYTSMLGTARWHFIRIEPNTADRMAVLPTSNSVLQ